MHITTNPNPPHATLVFHPFDSLQARNGVTIIIYYEKHSLMNCA